MKSKLKSSRKRMANRIGKRYQGQSPGVYTVLNAKQEEVQASNRARRRILVAIKRRSDKRKAPEPVGPVEVKL